MRRTLAVVPAIAQIIGIASARAGVTSVAQMRPRPDLEAARDPRGASLQLASVGMQIMALVLADLDPQRARMARAANVASLGGRLASMARLASVARVASQLAKMGRLASTARTRRPMLLSHGGPSAQAAACRARPTDGAAGMCLAAGSLQMGSSSRHLAGFSCRFISPFFHV